MLVMRTILQNVLLALMYGAFVMDSRKRNKLQHIIRAIQLCREMSVFCLHPYSLKILLLNAKTQCPSSHFTKITLGFEGHHFA